MTDRSSRSYEDLVLQAELADYAPVRGCMVIRPYGYGLWENIQSILNKRFKALGIENASFPTLIPESFLQREKEHVDGFSPQCAVVTHGGGKELEEPLILRPTSETIINEMYAKWINSYRDLPVLINQWANIFRWELRTKIFLRTMEFLWQEGHTVHETAEEAQEMTLQMLKVYRDFLQKDMGLFCLAGEKTPRERFAGARATYSVEVLLRDGKALQSGTSHNLGQNFAKVFNIVYQDRNQGQSIPYQTSWGMSTRLIGALILGHQDAKGLVLPPKIATVQVVVIPIAAHKEPKVAESCQKIVKDLTARNFRVKLDDRENVTPGWKFNEYELKGVPLRIELGKRDFEKGVVTMVERPNLDEKFSIPFDQIMDQVPTRLERIQTTIFESHRTFTLENLHYPKSYDDFKGLVDKKGGFHCMYWDGQDATEEKVQAETKATIRCIPLPEFNEELQEPKNKSNPVLGKADKPVAVVFAKSY